MTNNNLKNKKICLVTSTYYNNITKLMIRGSKKILYKNKIAIQNISVLNVPGCFEIPQVIAKKINNFDAFIALGCIIKGQTPHFNVLSNVVSYALIDLSITYKKPIGNGVITCLNKSQALERAHPNIKNKGGEATKSVIATLKI